MLPNDANDWTLAFGEVDSQSVGGGAPALVLEQVAPFSYASAIADAAGDLRILVTNEAPGPDATTRAALKGLYAKAAATGQSLFF